MRERDIEKYLVERVKALGGEVRKVKWTGRNGAPDRLVMLPAFRLKTGETPSPTVQQYLNRVEALIAQGCPSLATPVIWIELKAPGKKPEPHQAREHERMRRMGQRVEVIDSLERVDEVLS